MQPVRRLTYLAFRLLTGARTRTRRRFTRAGLAVLAGIIGAGLLTLDLSASAGYQAFILLAWMLGAAIACGWVFRGRFAAQRVLPRFGTVGVPLAYRVRLQNQTRATQRGLVLLEDLADARPGFEEFASILEAEEKKMRSFSITRSGSRWNLEMARVKEATVPALGPGQEGEARLELTPLKRGQMHFTGLTVARPDPLGLVRGFARIPLRQTVLVLPRRYLLPPIALPGTMKYQQGGVALASSVGQSEEYVALREYRQGDPLRHIHWRSWARVGQPVVKEFQDEFFVRHALILDTFTAHPRSDVFEEAVSVAASFACAIQTQESLLDLLFVGPEAYCFTSGRGLAHTDQMLEVLASVCVCREKPFEVLESLVLNHVSAVSGCICVLLAWDEPRQRLVTRLKQLGVPLQVFVIVERGASVLDAGPLRAEPQHLHALEAGKIEEGLSKL
jgi:uncharacterized protein (DUF58 family)